MLDRIDSASEVSHTRISSDLEFITCTSPYHVINIAPKSHPSTGIFQLTRIPCEHINKHGRSG